MTTSSAADEDAPAADATEAADATVPGARRRQWLCHPPAPHRTGAEVGGTV